MIFNDDFSWYVAALLEFNQSVLVSRKDPESRKQAVAQVMERLTSKGYWPQVRRFIGPSKLYVSLFA